MTESQLSICTWADATFGPAINDASIAAWALGEMAELVLACTYREPPQRIGEEIADVVIVLARLGRALEVDAIALAQAIHAQDGGNPGGDPLVLASAAVEHFGAVVCRLALNMNSRARIPFRHAVEALCDAAGAIAINLPAAIDAKMAVNRARKWATDGRGHGSHVKE